MRSRDYEELLESFNAHGVRYLVIGAHAVAFHARPRATKDLDVLVDPRPRNIERMLASIRGFRRSDLGLTVADFTSGDTIVQLGVAPSRIDLMSKLASAEFDALWKRRVKGRFSDVPLHFLSLEDLIREKEMTGRDQDRADVRVLKRARTPRPSG